MPGQDQSFDVDAVAQKYELDAGILRRQIQQESGGNPRARSPKGALGLMQLMPENAQGIDPYNPAQNVERGASIMGRLVKKYGGDYTKALAAYNAGEGAVDKAGGVPNYPETQAYIQAILGRRPPDTIKNAPAFHEIAASLPPDMSEDAYNAVRSKYFTDVILPKVGSDESILATRKQFMQMTERPHLLTTAGRAATAAQLGATSAAKAVIAPLTALDSLNGSVGSGPHGEGAAPGPITGLQSDLSVKEDSLTRIADREGLHSGAIKTVGTIGGQVASFEALSLAASPVAEEIAANFAHSVRTAKLATSTIRGGFAFGTYDALSADHNRMVEGVKGFGIGAAADLVLGTPGFLFSRVGATREVSEGLEKAAASGVKTPPPIDSSLAQKAVSTAETSRAEGRPNEIKYTNGQRGARVYVTDVSGNTQPIEIKQYREADVQRQVSNMVAQGGSVSHFEVHPEDQKVLNDYLKIQTNIEQAKYRGTTLSTPPGQAPAIARAGNAVGLPTEAVGSDTVHVKTVTHEIPPVQRPSDGGASPPPATRIAPTREEVDAYLERQGVAPKDKAFVGRSIEKAWDENIPTSEKQREIQIAMKYAPHMLPPEYTEYAIPRITDASSPMRGEIDANAVSDKVQRIGAQKLGYPIKVTDVVVGENPNRVRVYVRSGGDEQIDGSVRNALQDKLGPGYDIQFSPKEVQGRRFDVLGAKATDIRPRLQTDDDIEEALKFWDLKSSDVDVDALTRMNTTDMNRALDAARARIEDIGKGENIAENRAKVTDERRRMDKLAEDVVPPNERDKLSLSPGGFKYGDTEVPSLHAAIEEASGGKFVDQTPLQGNEAVLRNRPGGPKVITSPEGMETLSGSPNVAGGSHPDARKILAKLGIEPPASLGDATPVTILKEGETRPHVIWHENLHTNMHFTDAYDRIGGLIPERVRSTATDLMAGLKKMFGAYEQSSARNMANEAYVHASMAIRFDMNDYMVKLISMDTSAGHIADFVNETSRNLLRYTIDEAKDSIPTRNLQRSVSDLIRRTDTSVSYEVSHGIHITGSGTTAWYDASRGWVLQEGPTVQRTFNKLSDLWDHVYSNDKNFISPTYSFMPEQAGARGGMTPPGAEPDGSRPPNPEVSLGARMGFQALSKWWRPMMPWAASVDRKINEVMRVKGDTLPIYDAVKDVDDAEARSVATIDKWRDDSGRILNNFDFKKGYDVAQYLTHPESERTDNLLKQLGMTREEGQQAHLYEQWLKEFQNATSKSGGAAGGIDVVGFLRRDYPRLRMHEFDPSGVWGPGISEKNAGFWEKAVRYDKTLDPRDLNIHRLNSFLIRAGNEKMFTGEPLNKLNSLISRVDDNKQYLIPKDIRSGLQNYHDYMKGIPDDSKLSIEHALGGLFNGINERVAELNDHLPAPLRMSPITLPPRQFINRAMILSYTSGLGLRPAIAVRDGIWSLASSAMWLGARGSFTRGFIEAFNPESWARARAAGALLTTHNVGELLGDITQEMPTGGKDLFNRMSDFANMVLAPSRWTHNYGRAIMFNGEYLDALDAINEYRGTKPEVRSKYSGPSATIDTFFKNTSLPALDQAAQNRLLKYVNDPSMSPHAVAVKFGREAVDISQWPYRRGTQPMALRYTAGRILGQYGVWPANYVDFGARIGRLWFQNPSLAARMTTMWAATNFAASKGLESLGADSSKWFYLSPMGYAGSPNLEFVQNLMKSPEDTQEGREARRAVLSYPLDFVPATAEVESVLKGMKEPGGDAWPMTSRQMIRLLGFKPLDEHVTDRTWQEWLRYQAGYPKLKPGEE